jgi:hypothetical protein
MSIALAIFLHITTGFLNLIKHSLSLHALHESYKYEK